jgi:hypothetical protein
MDAEVSAQIGAGRYERNGERTTHRNGYRSRPWDTRLGTLELAVIEAEHLRAAIEQVEALGAMDITSIARED